MANTLKIADGLSVPLAAVTEKMAWLGRTGSGKTYGAMKLAETMLEAGAQIGVLDPVGVWRALRVPAAGGRSFDVVVFGGLYGDVPLEPSSAAGELVADLVVDRGLSFVLDISQFIPAEQQRFLQGFTHRFFHRKKSAPSAVHLFMEECQEYIPENPSGAEATTLGHMQRLWKLGRNFGIGGSLISQRPQEIAKKALNMSGTLFAFQMTGPQERKAIKAWVADQGVATDIEAILQKLVVGQPHVESPTFLAVSKTVRILPRVTADLSSTPKVGTAAAARRDLTPIDVEQLRAAMADTVERAKADDPKELRKELASVRQQLAKAQQVAPSKAASEKCEKQEVPAFTDADRELLRALRDEFEIFSNDIGARGEGLLGSMVNRARAAIDEAAENWTDELTKRRALFLERLEKTRVQRVLDKLDRVPTAPAPRPVATRSVQPHPNPAPMRQAAGSGDGAVKGGAFKSMLIALAQAGRPLADNQVAARAGMALSGTFDKYLGQQRTNGWVEGPRAALAITAAGLDALGPFDPLPTGVDLQAYWLNYVGGGKKREMLQVLIDAHPRALTDSEVAARANMALSGTFDKYLGQLRTLQLVSGSRQALQASAELFA